MSLNLDQLTSDFQSNSLLLREGRSIQTCHDWFNSLLESSDIENICVHILHHHLTNNDEPALFMATKLLHLSLERKLASGVAPINTDVSSEDLMHILTDKSGMYTVMEQVCKCMSIFVVLELFAALCSGVSVSDLVMQLPTNESEANVVEVGHQHLLSNLFMRATESSEVLWYMVRILEAIPSNALKLVFPSNVTGDNYKAGILNSISEIGKHYLFSLLQSDEALLQNMSTLKEYFQCCLTWTKHDLPAMPSSMPFDGADDMTDTSGLENVPILRRVRSSSIDIDASRYAWIRIQDFNNHALSVDVMDRVLQYAHYIVQNFVSSGLCHIISGGDASTLTLNNTSTQETVDAMEVLSMILEVITELISFDSPTERHVMNCQQDGQEKKHEELCTQTENLLRFFLLVYKIWDGLCGSNEGAGLAEWDQSLRSSISNDNIVAFNETLYPAISMSSVMSVSPLSSTLIDISGKLGPHMINLLSAYKCTNGFYEATLTHCIPKINDDLLYSLWASEESARHAIARLLLVSLSFPNPGACIGLLESIPYLLQEFHQVHTVDKENNAHLINGVMGSPMGMPSNPDNNQSLLNDILLPLLAVIIHQVESPRMIPTNAEGQEILLKMELSLEHRHMTPEVDLDDDTESYANSYFDFRADSRAFLRNLVTFYCPNSNLLSIVYQMMMAEHAIINNNTDNADGHLRQMEALLFVWEGMSSGAYEDMHMAVSRRNNLSLCGTNNDGNNTKNGGFVKASQFTTAKVHHQNREETEGHVALEILVMLNGIAQVVEALLDNLPYQILIRRRMLEVWNQVPQHVLHICANKRFLQQNLGAPASSQLMSTCLNFLHTSMQLPLLQEAGISSLVEISKHFNFLVFEHRESLCQWIQSSIAQWTAQISFFQENDSSSISNKDDCVLRKNCERLNYVLGTMMTVLSHQERVSVVNTALAPLDQLLDVLSALKITANIPVEQSQQMDYVVMNAMQKYIYHISLFKQLLLGYTDQSNEDESDDSVAAWTEEQSFDMDASFESDIGYSASSYKVAFTGSTNNSGNLVGREAVNALYYDICDQVVNSFAIMHIWSENNWTYLSSRSQPGTSNIVWSALSITATLLSHIFDACDNEYVNQSDKSHACVLRLIQILSHMCDMGATGMLNFNVTNHVQSTEMCSNTSGVILLSSSLIKHFINIDGFIGYIRILVGKCFNTIRVMRCSILSPLDNDNNNNNNGEDRKDSLVLEDNVMTQVYQSLLHENFDVSFISESFRLLRQVHTSLPELLIEKYDADNSNNKHTHNSKNDVNCYSGVSVFFDALEISTLYLEYCFDLTLLRQISVSMKNMLSLYDEDNVEIKQNMQQWVLNSFHNKTQTWVNACFISLRGVCYAPDIRIIRHFAIFFDDMFTVLLLAHNYDIESKSQMGHTLKNFVDLLFNMLSAYCDKCIFNGMTSDRSEKVTQCMQSMYDNLLQGLAIIEQHHQQQQLAGVLDSIQHMGNHVFKQQLVQCGTLIRKILK